MAKDKVLLAKKENIATLIKQSGLMKDIIRCSKEDYDILKRENQDYFRRQFHSHCRRVWQRLEPSKRQAMREWIKRSQPEHNDDMWCVEEIEKLLKKESLPYFQIIS